MVLPLYDRNPTVSRPVVTWALVAVTVVVFLAEPVGLTSVLGRSSSLADLCAETQFFRRWGAVPAELLGGAQLPEVTGPAGVDSCRLQDPTYEKVAWLSAFTSVFLHGGWLHLAGNMLFLLVFGNNVEDRFGHARFLAFYLLAGAAAAYGDAVFSPGSTTPLVGASGAVSGVLGAYVVLFPRAKVLVLVTFFFFVPLSLPAVAVLGFWFAQQAFFALASVAGQEASVAYLAHVVGFVGGAGLVLALRRALGRDLRVPALVTRARRGLPPARRVDPLGRRRPDPGDEEPWRSWR